MRRADADTCLIVKASADTASPPQTSIHPSIRRALRSAGLASGITSLKLKGRFDDKLIGKVQLPVAGVAREGRVRGTWPLMAARSGEIELKLNWTRIRGA